MGLFLVFLPPRIDGAEANFSSATARSSSVSQSARPFTRRHLTGQVSRVLGEIGNSRAEMSFAPCRLSTRTGIGSYMGDVSGVSLSAGADLSACVIALRSFLLRNGVSDSPMREIDGLISPIFCFRPDYSLGAILEDWTLLFLSPVSLRRIL